MTTPAPRPPAQPPRRGGLEIVQLAATGILVVCALLVTGKVIGRTPPPPPPRSSTEYVDAPDWREYAAVGHRLGPDDARVTIVDFSDYQCPACAQFEPALRAIQARYPRDVAVVYRHYPLDRPHPQAHAAAIASECAAVQGHFAAMHEVLFARHREFGTVSWRELASVAGVPALDRFDRCMQDSSTAGRVREDRAAAAAIAARGTPTVFVNAVRFAGSVREATLDSLVQAQLAKR